MTENIADEIKQAFLSSPIPPPLGCVSASCYDDEGTTKVFLGTSWEDHRPENLALFTHSLTYFTPEAFAYFLPAFMLASLCLPSSGIFDGLIFRLAPPKGNVHRPSFVAWWSLLSLRQRGSVIAFLDHLRDCEPDSVLPVIRALREVC